MGFQLLFPETVQVSGGDAQIIMDLFSELRRIGFDLEEFGENTFIVHGVPSNLNNQPVNDVLEDVIESFKTNQKELAANKRINLARSMAVRLASGMNGKLQPEEMMALVGRLFGCSLPDVSPDGRPVVKIIGLNDLDLMFK